MTSVRVHLNADGIRALLRDDKVADMLMERMGPVLQQARETAPTWRHSQGMTDAHRDSLRLERHEHNNRVTAVVIADAQWSRLIEAKTGHMARALDAAGGEGGDPNELIEYTTEAGKTRMATRAQVAHWTRGTRR